MMPKDEVQCWKARIDAAGQLSLPPETRQLLGLGKTSDVVVESDGDSLRILSLDRFQKEVDSIPAQDNRIIKMATSFGTCG